MCYARLSRRSDEEISSKVELESQGLLLQSRAESTALNALAITLLLTTIVGASFLGIALYRRKMLRNAKSKSSSLPPPAYEYFQKDLEVKINPDSKF